MPVLSNPRHEAFAHALAKGASATDAYVSAGYSEAGAAASANRLLKNANVAARVAELQSNVEQRVIEKISVSKAWVVDQLVDIVQKAKTDVEMTDREGNGLGVYTFQGSVATKALELIGKELGMFVDRKDITTRKSVADLSNEEVDELIADAERRAGALTPTASGAIQ